MRIRWLAWLASVFCGGGLHAGYSFHLGTDTRLSFASIDSARTVLGARDTFVERLSPFDRAARIHTDAEVSEDEFLRFAASSAREWTDADRERLAAAWERVRPGLEPLRLPFPAEVLFVATSGAEEGGAAYTRGAAIVFPPATRAKPADQLAEVLAHELFHVLSRHAPSLRNRCYACIGFRPCGELEFPAAWRDRAITNPDAPFSQHYIEVMIAGKTTPVMPVLFASAERYDTVRGGEFFDYLEARLLPVDPAPVGGITQSAPGPNGVEFVEFAAATDFLDQVGRNTGYIIHPEEILADNFRFLVLGTPNLPNPEIVACLRSTLGRFVESGSRSHPGPHEAGSTSHARD